MGRKKMTANRRVKLGLMGSTVLALAAAPYAANAQTNATAEAGATAPADDGAPEIVVTGQKRAENIIDVPKQVAVASGDQLKTAGVNRLTELQNAFPTITTTTNTSGASPRPPGIRGIAPFTVSVGVQSQTGVVVDDVPQATFSTLAFELADVERVEVFAGPQTTLSGRNASAGLINIVTRSPQFTPHYDFSLEQTTDHQTRATAFATGPLTDKLAFSLSVLFNDWAGPYRNALRGNERVGGFNTRGARGKLLWNATDDFKLTLTGYYLHTTGKTIPILGSGALISGPTNAGGFILDTKSRPLGTIYPGVQVGPDNRAVYSPYNGTAETIDQGGTVRGDLEVGSLGTLSSITSYTDSSQPRDDIFVGVPRDSLSLPLTDYNATADIQSKNFTQEIRLTSPGTGPFTYLLGAIYSKIKLHQIYYRTQLFPFVGDQNVDTTSGAIFGRATYDFTPNDSLTGGLRYQHDKLFYIWHVLTAGTTVSTSSNSYGFWGGEVSYKHKFDERVNVYATYSQSETGNAYNLNDTTTASTGAPLPVIASTHVRSYEVGFKSELFDRVLTLNADLFYEKFKNFQVQNSIITPQSIRTDLFAIGRVVSKGVEFNAALHPSRDLNLTLTGAYIDAKITDYPNGPCYTAQSAAEGCVTVAPGVKNQGNLAGRSLPFSPKFRFSAGADYTAHAGDIDVLFGAFYTYQSKMNTDLLGDPVSEQRGYGILNLNAGPVDPDGKWSLSFFVNNVLDKRNVAIRARTQFINPFVSSDPAVFGQYNRNSFRYAGVRFKANM
jgi:iron complex outermembrane recepter protein